MDDRTSHGGSHGGSLALRAPAIASFQMARLASHYDGLSSAARARCRDTGATASPLTILAGLSPTILLPPVDMSVAAPS